MSTRGFVKNVARAAPIPISGLLLGLASAGNTFSDHRWFFGFFAFTILGILILKIALDTRTLLAEMSNNGVIGIMCTFPMATSILSLYLVPSMPSIAYGMWFVSVVLHLALILYFTLLLLPRFKVSMSLPSYFVVYVGIAVNGYIAPVHGHPMLGEMFVWFGLISLLLLMPPLFYRAFIMRTIPTILVPTMAIFTAPSSLVLVAYFVAFDSYEAWVVFLLLTMTLVTYVLVLSLFPNIIRNGFFPTFSSLTFPMVISAAAVMRSYEYLSDGGYDVGALRYIGGVMEIIAMVIVIGVLGMYVFNYLIKPYLQNRGHPESEGM